MCGICGKFNFDPEDRVQEGLILKMCQVIKHRGPDDEGVYLSGSIGLGHRRLSIIDLSPAGHQPMSNRAGTLWIVFNGEIYNFLDIRKELENKGYAFRSKSDTEVILALYEQEGEECVQKLRGMFAFAIWDSRKSLLFLARDRLGKKPMFYCLQEKSFVFGSELKAILQDPSVRRDISPEAIHHYLTYQYVPAPFCIFRNVYKLPPAHYLVCQNGNVSIKRYWRLSHLPKIAIHSVREENDMISRLREMLEEAVRIRLMSDVPLGAFLSGGLDSSIIVGLMAKCMDRPVKTFSIGFPEKEYNETQYARIVAEHFHTDHTEFQVKPDALEILPKLVWHYDEPYADSSAIPTFVVSQLATQHVKVVLNGDGGDENFAGYERYMANCLAQRFQTFFPPSLIRMLLPFVLAIPHGPRPSGLLWKAKRFFTAASMPAPNRIAHWLSHFTQEMKQEMYTSEFRNQVQGIVSEDLLFQKYQEAEADNLLERNLYVDAMMYLPDDLLVKVDIASMANSLETRAPFLDHKVMEFVARIPPRYKLKERQGKYILKQAFQNELPAPIISRSKKGFGVPLDFWFRNELRQMVYDTLLSPQAIQRGYFQKSFIERMLQEHISGKWNWSHTIYNLLMLELWHRK